MVKATVEDEGGFEVEGINLGRDFPYRESAVDLEVILRVIPKGDRCRCDVTMLKDDELEDAVMELLTNLRLRSSPRRLFSSSLSRLIRSFFPSFFSLFLLVSLSIASLSSESHNVCKTRLSRRHR